MSDNINTENIDNLVNKVDNEIQKASTTIKDLFSSIDSDGNAILPLLTELENKNEQTDMLVQKAKLLLGLAEKFRHDPRGIQLRQDAEQILTFANDLQNDENVHSVLTQAQFFLDTVHEKYETRGRELFKQTQEMWDELLKSQEVGKLLEAGNEILGDWQLYGGSEEFQELIDNLSKNISESVLLNGSKLLDLVKDYEINTEKFLENGQKYKQALEKVANEVASEVNTLINDDEEIKTWIEQGKAYLNKSSDLNKEENIKSTDKVLDNVTNVAQEYLDKIKESEFGKEVIKKSTELLNENNELLKPEKLISNIKLLSDNPEARNELIMKLKEAALQFLLEYLPGIKIEPYKVDDENAYYFIDNMSLSGFRCSIKDIDIILTDNGVQIKAKNISCLMENLEWLYRGKSFPYIHTGGKAVAEALDIRFVMNFEVERYPRNSNLREDIKNIKYTEDDLKTDAQLKKEMRDQQRERRRIAKLKEQKRKQNNKKNNKEDLSLADDYLNDNFYKDYINTYGKDDDSDNNDDDEDIDEDDEDNYSDVDSDESLSSDDEDYEDRKRQRQEKRMHKHIRVKDNERDNIVVNLKELQLETALDYDYALVLVREKGTTFITVPTLTVSIHGSWFSSLYNALLNYFNNEVRGYVEYQLNDCVKRKSGDFLYNVNKYAEEYLPLFSSFKTKIESKAPKIMEVAKKAADTIVNEGVDFTELIENKSSNKNINNTENTSITNEVDYNEEDYDNNNEEDNNNKNNRDNIDSSSE